MNQIKVRLRQTVNPSRGITTALAKVNSRPSIIRICHLADRLNTHKKIHSLIEQREARNFEFSLLINKALQTLV